MIKAGVKKALAERGWNPLNMNCLNHRDIIQTKVPDHEEEEVSLSQVSELTETHIDFPTNLTEADIRVIEQGPSTIRDFNFNGCITRQVFENCVKRQDRLKAQDDEIKERRRRIREEGLAQVQLLGKLSSGKLYKNGITCVSDPNYIRNQRERNKLEKREQYLSNCKEYIVAKQKFDEGVLLSKEIEEEQQLNPNMKLTNKQLETLIRWKWSILPKKDRPSPSTLKGPTKEITRNLKLSEWAKWETKIDPCPPLIPKGFELYDVEGDDKDDGLEQLTDLKFPLAFPKIDSSGSFDSLDSNEDDVNSYVVPVELSTV